MLMERLEEGLKTLFALKEMGVRLAIDDFGTGYSSLAYLKRFPLDSLKVDRSFIKDLPGDADDAAITKAIVAMAHSLKLEVVAEGVETTEQLAFLQQQGCDQIQGFLFSRPLPADQVPELLTRGGIKIAKAS
jgi:EAL domain-containing protein (putative c-di-GMP-specific phosphodiesterase class I)